MLAAVVENTFQKLLLKNNLLILMSSYVNREKEIITYEWMFIFSNSRIILSR